MTYRQNQCGQAQQHLHRVFRATPPTSLGVPADFTAGPFFATDLLRVFSPGFGPTLTSVEPQPLITDVVAKTIFPLDLTNPETIPTQNVQDPVVLPPSDLTKPPTVISPFINLSTPALIQLPQNAFTEKTQILNNTEKTFNTTCQQCMSSLLVLQNLTHAVPCSGRCHHF